MKYLAHIIIALGLSLIFISCKKDISGEGSNNQKSNIIVEFLKKGQQDKRPLANAFLENIIESLQFDISYSEEYRNDKPMQFLLVTENNLGKIRRMDIVLFYPKSNSLKKLPSGFFTTLMWTANFS